MSKYIFGVDVGGTSVKMGLFDITGMVIDKWEIPTRTENGGERILPDIAESINEKIAEKQYLKEDIAGIGLAVPGPVTGNGVVNNAVNLGWGITPVKETMERLCGIPAEVGNDANVAALGEMWKGGGQGHTSLVLVTLGTGVGGGVIIDGRLVTGADGAGGEIGHMHVMDDEEEACNCGCKGCLEQYGSATGIVRLAKRTLTRTEKPSVLRETDVTAKAVFDAVKDGDRVAEDIAKEFGEILGKGFAMIASVLNPEAFVIGGGVSKAGEVLFDYIRPAFEKYVFPGAKGAKFVLATLGNDAGIYGSAKLVLDKN
ncbi:MAG: ROK family glucokinase [Lachnospiraceae bacterium]|nr:ROK family glucokinase [Lachnospiraceae bacterium]